MPFQYTWLKILEVLAKGAHQMGPSDLRSELTRRGFALSEVEFEDALERLQAQGLLEMLVLAGRSPQSIGSVAITPKGEKKIRDIVRF